MLNMYELFFAVLFHCLQISLSLIQSCCVTYLCVSAHTLFHLYPNLEAETFESKRNAGTWENYSLHLLF